MDILGYFDVQTYDEYNLKIAKYKNLMEEMKKILEAERIPCIKQIIFNEPVTVVLWQDGTKTVVRAAKNDVFDEEYGVAMAYVKKLFGSRAAFKKMVVKYKLNYKQAVKQKG